MADDPSGGLPGVPGEGGDGAVAHEPDAPRPEQADPGAEDTGSTAKTVICKSCGSENIWGDLKCWNCKRFIPGNLETTIHHPERGRDTRAAEARNKAREVVEDAGLDWDTLDAGTKILVEAGVKDRSTAGDRKMMMQQVEMLKPVPKVGKDEGVREEVVVIQADKSVSLQLAVEAMDVVKAAGGTKFLIATEPVE